MLPLPAHLLSPHPHRRLLPLSRGKRKKRPEGQKRKRRRRTASNRRRLSFSPLREKRAFCRRLSLSPSPEKATGHDFLHRHGVSGRKRGPDLTGRTGPSQVRAGVHGFPFPPKKKKGEKKRNDNPTTSPASRAISHTKGKKEKGGLFGL